MSTLTQLTDIQARVAHEIIAYIRRENIQIGTHLPEVKLAQVAGTSRFPVRAALKYLEEHGILRSDNHKGFYLDVSITELKIIAQKLFFKAEDPVYLLIAEYRLCGKLPDIVTESQLMRLFSASRFVIQKALSRIQEEGWIEKRAGKGWVFLAMIDSLEAFNESYDLRQLIEPAGILRPSFRVDMSILKECRRQQEFIANKGYAFMTPFELFEASTRFHEVIAVCSGNRFAVQTIKRLNQLRRLVEYQHAKVRPARKIHAENHLEIIDALYAKDFTRAASMMKEHLEKSRKEKIDQNLFVFRKRT